MVENNKPHPDNKSLQPVEPPANGHYEGQIFDILLHSWQGRFTGWLSPASVSLAFFDWLSHFSMAPAKQIHIARKNWQNVIKLLFFAIHCQQTNTSLTEHCMQLKLEDKRFKEESWNNFPFSLYVQQFLMIEQAINEMTWNIRGATPHHLRVVNFVQRQFLDIFSPSNFPWTNPEILEKTFETKGQNFIDGAANLMEDLFREWFHLPSKEMEKFKVGVNLAVTPGKVVFRNRLMELIQYSPATEKVYPEPIFIIPAWIMKYYILDLSAHNSLVRYLVSKGHTVFMISWKNPGHDDRDFGFDTYVNHGILEGLQAILNIVPARQVHAVGYCLGGTLLSMVAAALAGRSDDRFKSVTLFAAQVDFREPGELQLFIDHSQVTYLEDIMWEQGYLNGKQMAGAFSMIRSNDLVWSRIIHDYFLGARRPLNDLMAWDHDATRLPYRFHSEYLHNLFLNNDLVQGRFRVNHRRIALSDIRVPIFLVGTQTDHIAPWRSVYKLHLFTDTEITFVLTSGGHNAGIVSEPGHRGRSYQMRTRKPHDKYLTSDCWLEKAPSYQGSWWPVWQQWLVEQSGNQISPPPMGNVEKDYPPLCDAPGTYVFQK
ncbi:PHA/PHB synthase family protein [Legionella genomosp. 1]|uniref:PHA/PHB synthase family protein n=1 Tax=Legionella genomosp. 1 TaxID=1093625 RepID=UPI001055189F|nr:alpha/beta fold hydrolase [Legionella genomosp. 1]